MYPEPVLTCFVLFFSKAVKRLREAANSNDVDTGENHQYYKLVKLDDLIYSAVIACQLLFIFSSKTAGRWY